MIEIPKVAADLMVKNVVTCSLSDTLGQVRHLMKEHHIRHLPVVDADSGEYVGLVTHRTVLREAIAIANKFGMAEMEHQESKRYVESLVERDAETVQVQLPLREAGEFFNESKHGCLPVLEEGKVVGILTSSDFVKLSVRLLAELEGD